MGNEFVYRIKCRLRDGTMPFPVGTCSVEYVFSIRTKLCVLGEAASQLVMPRTGEKKVNHRFRVPGKGINIECDSLDSVNVRNPEMGCRIPERHSRETCASIFFVYCYA